MMNVNRPSGVNMNPYQKPTAEQLSQRKKSKVQDEVHISKQAQKMLEKHTQLDSARKQKVARLKEAVQSGNYQVDTYQVAEKIYQFWFGKKE